MSKLLEVKAAFQVGDEVKYHDSTGKVIGIRLAASVFASPESFTGEARRTLRQYGETNINAQYLVMFESDQPIAVGPQPRLLWLFGGFLQPTAAPVCAECGKDHAAEAKRMSEEGETDQDYHFTLTICASGSSPEEAWEEAAASFISNGQEQAMPEDFTIHPV